MDLDKWLKVEKAARASTRYLYYTKVLYLRITESSPHQRNEGCIYSLADFNSHPSPHSISQLLIPLRSFPQINHSTPCGVTSRALPVRLAHSDAFLSPRHFTLTLRTRHHLHSRTLARYVRSCAPNPTGMSCPMEAPENSPTNMCPSRTDWDFSSNLSSRRLSSRRPLTTRTRGQR